MNKYLFVIDFGDEEIKTGSIKAETIEEAKKIIKSETHYTIMPAIHNDKE